MAGGEGDGQELDEERVSHQGVSSALLSAQTTTLHSAQDTPPHMELEEAWCFVCGPTVHRPLHPPWLLQMVERGGSPAPALTLPAGHSSAPSRSLARASCPSVPWCPVPQGTPGPRAGPGGSGVPLWPVGLAGAAGPVGGPERLLAHRGSHRNFRWKLNNLRS